MTQFEALSVRIDALEERIAFQDRTIEELNGVVTEQWTLIEALKRRLARLDDRMGEVEASTGQGVPIDRPPHY